MCNDFVGVPVFCSVLGKIHIYFCSLPVDTRGVHPEEAEDIDIFVCEDGNADGGVVGKRPR